MKSLMLAMLLMLAPLTAQADAKFDTCNQYAEYARVVMQARQDNYGIATVWPKDDDKMLQAIVISAWKKPVWATAPYKADAVEKFSSEIFVICWENLK